MTSPSEASGNVSGIRADSRERIVVAAVRVFARKGFQRASLDEIAAEAGLTKGAIYWHFSSKNDLFFSLLESRFQRHATPLPGDIAQAATISDAAGRKRALYLLFRDTLSRFREDADWPRLLLEFLAQSRDAEMAARLSQLSDFSRQVARQAVEQMQQCGLADPKLDPGMMAIFWCALVDGLMLAWVVKPETFADDRLIERMVDMLATGMLSGPGRNGAIRQPCGRSDTGSAWRGRRRPAGSFLQ